MLHFLSLSSNQRKLTEMDKNSDVRHVFNRKSGNVEKEKTSKETIVKRLSVIGRERGFEGKDELHSHSSTVTAMKSKLPRKIFSASKVPKKQRSVRKGCSEFVSVPLLGVKRSNNRVNGAESIRNDCLKKSKHSGWSDHSSKRSVSEAISKDEEEVAEALFALKGITLDRDNKTNNESLEPISPDLKKLNTNLTISSQEARTLKEESDATDSTPTTDQTLTADPAPPIWSKLSERRQLIPDLKASVPPVPFQFPPLLRACDDRQRTDSTLLCGSTDQNSDSGIGETKPEKSQLPKKESHINIGLSDSANCQNKEHSTSTECGDIAALPSKPLHGSGVGFPVQSSAILVPSWLNNNNSLSCPGSYDDITFSGKVPCSINGGRKSWKRCVAHVYISHLIQVLKTSEGKDLNGTPTAGHMFGSASMSKTANDVPMLHEKCIAKEDGPSISGFHDSKKQSFDFLSLSTGAAPDVNNGVDRLDISMEPKGHVPQLNSVAQHNAYMPSSMLLNHFPSIPYNDQGTAVSIALPHVPPQGHLRVPPYLNNPCGSTHMGTARTTQQPLSKHHHQQQQMLTTKIAAQFWHNSIRDQHSMNHKQAHLPAPLHSLESIGSKYFHVSEQQLQMQLQLQQLQLQQQQQQQLFGRYPPLPRSGGKLQNTQPT